MTLNIKHFSELTTDELYRMIQARIAVFVVEQNCPYQELDGKDIFKNEPETLTVTGTPSIDVVPVFI